MLSELRVHRRVETVFLKLSSQKVQGWFLLHERLPYQLNNLIPTV